MEPLKPEWLSDLIIVYSKQMGLDALSDLIKNQNKNSLPMVVRFSGAVFICRMWGNLLR